MREEEKTRHVIKRRRERDRKKNKRDGIKDNLTTKMKRGGGVCALGSLVVARKAGASAVAERVCLRAAVEVVVRMLVDSYTAACFPNSR